MRRASKNWKRPLTAREFGSVAPRSTARASMLRCARRYALLKRWVSSRRRPAVLGTAPKQTRGAWQFRRPRRSDDGSNGPHHGGPLRTMSSLRRARTRGSGILRRVRRSHAHGRSSAASSVASECAELSGSTSRTERTRTEQHAGAASYRGAPYRSASDAELRNVQRFAPPDRAAALHVAGPESPARETSRR